MDHVLSAGQYCPPGAGTINFLIRSDEMMVQSGVGTVTRGTTTDWSEMAAHAFCVRKLEVECGTISFGARSGMTMGGCSVRSAITRSQLGGKPKFSKKQTQILLPLSTTLL